MRIILYQARQTDCGGVETFNLNFCKRLSKYYDITFVCDSSDPVQKARIEKYVDVVEYDGQFFETDICIYSSAWGKRPEDHIKAKRYIQMVHADFSGLEKHWNFSYKKTPLTTEHWGGGKNIAKTFKERYGYDCEVVPYLLDNKMKTSQVLHLITLSRIGKEKGFTRVVEMAKRLKASGRKFNWDIWGNSHRLKYEETIKKQLVNIKEVSFRGLGSDLMSFVADADYLVQLSDTEGYCFSMYEAISLNTPVIATDFPNAREQITDGENGYIVDMDLDCFDDKFIEKLYKKIPKFKFEPLAEEEDWIKMIGKPRAKGERRKKVDIKEPEKSEARVIRAYFDIVLERRVSKGEVIKLSESRFDKLKKMGLIEIMIRL